MDILFAEGSERKTIVLPEETIKDLALQEVIEWMSSSPEERTILKTIMSQVLLDPADMRFRQEIFRDLKKNPELRDAMQSSIAMIKTMKEFTGAKRAVSNKDHTLYTLLSDLRNLSVYADTMNFLSEKLGQAELESTALVRLREEVNAVTSSEEFQEVGEDIKTMLEDLSTVRSCIIGVNFAPDLTIEEVAAVEFLPYLTRSKYRFADIAATLAMVTSAGQNAQGVGAAQVKQMKMTDPLLAALGPLIEKELKRHFSSFRKVLSQYAKLDTHAITEMHEGLVFYTCCARAAERLEKQGYTLCTPVIEKTEDKRWEAKGLYSIRLAIKEEKNIVKNDFTFSEKERIFVLTGPNRGGKTIIEQGLGLISVFASIGFFVTADSFRGMPFRNIYTHFPIDENLTLNYGRLGEEASRIRTIVRESDSDTLILFNETYSTTSSIDALYLSQDLLHILKEKGAAVIFNTHIHELARDIEKMNEWDGKSSIVSVVMEIKDNVNTFKLLRSEPDTSSYARNIALKYGVTYEQMKEEQEKKT